ncbi:MAG: sulfate adenylyltransferase subunit CysD [Alphaproteobacteria bacterium]|nr:MAG: sulfate adenylyltransferase subunit CysD [Alphaproteobacteria bacterium]
MSKSLPLYLQELEDEAIFIIREAIAVAENPVLLYSIGKDSSVLLHLLLKAFAPAKPPVPLLHVDTTWKFKEMIEFRDRVVKQHGLQLIVHTNQDGVDEGINPFDHGSKHYTNVMKTDGLKQVLDKHKFDYILIGARRDEEKSRAKERIFSTRNRFHAWDPKNQQSEFGWLFNTRLPQGFSSRVSPLSNWTEQDIWEYILHEKIELVSLYFAKEQPVVERDGMLIRVDDDRLPIEDKSEIQNRKVRFRTLGCYPLTAAMPSEAETLEEIVAELLESKESERQGRLIDKDSASAMEQKKKMGYF